MGILLEVSFEAYTHTHTYIYTHGTGWMRRGEAKRLTKWIDSEVTKRMADKIGNFNSWMLEHMKLMHIYKKNNQKYLVLKVSSTFFPLPFVCAISLSTYSNLKCLYGAQYIRCFQTICNFVFFFGVLFFVTFFRVHLPFPFIFYTHTICFHPFSSNSW